MSYSSAIENHSNKRTYLLRKCKNTQFIELFFLVPHNKKHIIVNPLGDNADDNGLDLNEFSTSVNQYNSREINSQSSSQCCCLVGFTHIYLFIHILITDCNTVTVYILSNLSLYTY